ncbi:MAG: DEAD/DEAH box helicase [Phycisphaeraceae bacterium]|nr:DEAD/DEAH box helicase [Phycisphaeraceae bacterium]
MLFSDLGLAEPILRAVAAEGYTVATPIQTEAIPHVLAGRDLLGCAQTGTGKTAAFALPILHRLSDAAPGHDHAAAPHTTHKSTRRGPHGTDRTPRCLVLCPTRELAAQIHESFRAYGRHVHLKSAVIYGGVSQNPQVAHLRAGLDVLIATPGRLMDLMEQGHVDLGRVQMLVLDEADRMLDMGFIPDIKRITRALPAKRQTLLFSATMPGPIRRLAHDLLHDPVNIEVTPDAPTVVRVAQSVYHVESTAKTALLAKLLESGGLSRTIVFTRTKHRADRLSKYLCKIGATSEAIHGDKSQGARDRALKAFRDGKVGVLVATDIAARGIDIDDISHVVNFDLPRDPESYVHRIGRTARAGASGCAVSFCGYEERSLLTAIEGFVRAKISVERTPALPREASPRGGGEDESRRDHHAPAPRHAARPAAQAVASAPRKGHTPHPAGPYAGVASGRSRSHAKPSRPRRRR